MRVSSQMKTKYPKLTKWIVINIPKVLQKSKVFHAFKKYSELSHLRTIEVLTKNSGPVLVDWYFPENHDGAKGRKNGRSNMKGHSKNIICLARDICDKFENSNKAANDPRMHLLLESTILHEMVHWGDRLDGVRQSGEEGKKFEKEAYERDVNPYWSSVE